MNNSIKNSALRFIEKKGYCHKDGSKITQKEAEDIVKVVLDSILEEVAETEVFQYRGEFTLKLSERKARVGGLNGITNEPFNIPARKVITFKMGSKLKDRINQ